MAMYLADRMAAFGPFEVVHNGRDGIPTVCWKLKEGVQSGFTLFDFADRLQCRGWQVPAYTLPANCESTVVQRIVVRHGVSRSLADGLLADMRRSLEFLQTHPSATDPAKRQSGFRHT